ncbi:hypothetical protein [Rhodohalobacter sp.]|uniref:hypothetical protein n=1 Tax=Rhodohalobacter sp. TaxID=1974210 RepID=UPI0035679293
MLKTLLLVFIFAINPPVLLPDSYSDDRIDHISKVQYQSEYSYCKPDEDPNFSRIYEDELYYYYTGKKVISGLIYQTNKDAPVTFDSRTDQACQFELTQGFQVDISLLDEDFSIHSAWEKAPECDPSEGEPYLSGIYSLTITGFKISKAYIDNYDPQRIRSQMDMRRFEFYADYDKVDEVIAPAEVKCPVVLR